MSTIMDSVLSNGNLVSAVNHLLHFPEELEKHLNQSHSHSTHEVKSTGSIPVDILETSKEFVFYLDVPGLSKSDIQVTVEDEKTLVIRSSQGKRKREDGDDEECKFIRMERKTSPKFTRKFNLPENVDVSAISAKCENGVLSVTVKKLPPASKPKTVEIAIA